MTAINWLAYSYRATIRLLAGTYYQAKCVKGNMFLSCEILLSGELGYRGNAYPAIRLRGHKGNYSEVEVEVEHCRPMDVPWKVRMGPWSPHGFTYNLKLSLSVLDTLQDRPKNSIPKK